MSGGATAQEAGWLPLAQPAPTGATPTERIAPSENCAKLLLCVGFEAQSICPVQGRSEIFQNIFALPLDLC